MENTKASNHSKTSNQILSGISNHEVLNQMDRLVKSERKITHTILS